MNQKQIDIEAALKAQFAELPKAVQKAILSSHVEASLQALAKKYQIHLDQWVHLENEVMMVLLGLRTIGSLAGHIEEEAEVDKATAEALANDISDTVFEPIREELARELAHPDAQPKEESVDEHFRQQALAEAHQAERTADGQQPTISSKGEQNTPPRSLDTDPYREPVA